MANAAVHFLYRREKSNDNLFHVSQRAFALLHGGKKKKKKPEKVLFQPSQNNLNITYTIYNPITSTPLSLSL